MPSVLAFIVPVWSNRDAEANTADSVRSKPATYQSDPSLDVTSEQCVADPLSTLENQMMQIA